MPSLDIATLQPSFRGHHVQLGVKSIIPSKILPNPWKRSWLNKNFEVYTKILHFRRRKLVIAAVATLESKISVQKEIEGRDSPSPTDIGSSIDEDVEQLDKRESLRRMRISKANRGNTPWNKGRKHSPETLQKIRERTKLAMQNPKVKMKLVNLGHAQSKETRLKIGEGVKLRWKRRRERKRVQQKCHSKWKDLVAEAARRGTTKDEEELQWNSYDILDEHLRQERIKCKEEKKAMREAKCNRNAPKSYEQRRKIAEAIAAKWADPAYRERVNAGLLRYHGASERTERRKRKPSARTSEPRKRSPATKKSTRNTEPSSSGGHIRGSHIKTPQLKKRTSRTPVYKDPLVSSKLEMIISIREKRATETSHKIEAVKHARRLIAEAEKAAKDLEIAAKKSVIAQAALLESRKLIAEATRMIESITCKEDDGEAARQKTPGNINGARVFAEDIEVVSEIQSLRSEIGAKQCGYGRKQPTDDREEEEDRTIELSDNGVPNGAGVHVTEEKDVALPLRPAAVIKKWVRGKLVQVTDED